MTVSQEEDFFRVKILIIKKIKINQFDANVIFFLRVFLEKNIKKCLKIPPYEPLIAMHGSTSGPFFCILSSRVADPGGFYPDPTFEKNPDTDSTLENNLDPDPTLF